MKKSIILTVAGIAAALGGGQASATFNGHPLNHLTYYEIDVQPITTINFQTGANINAYYLVPFIPLPPPPMSIADPLMINGYIIQAASDEAAAGIFGAWVSGQLPLSAIQAMAKGTIHQVCTDIGGAPPALTFKVTDNPNEVANLAAICHSVANFNGDHISLTGLVNQIAFEGNWQSCYTQAPAPIPSELGITGGTGVFNRSRGQLKVTAVKIFNPATGTCERPGPVKRLKWSITPW